MPPFLGTQGPKKVGPVPLCSNRPMNGPRRLMGGPARLKPIIRRGKISPPELRAEYSATNRPRLSVADLPKRVILQAERDMEDRAELHNQGGVADSKRKRKKLCWETGSTIPNTTLSKTYNPSDIKPKTAHPLVQIGGGVSIKPAVRKEPASKTYRNPVQKRAKPSKNKFKPVLQQAALKTGIDSVMRKEQSKSIMKPAHKPKVLMEPVLRTEVSPPPSSSASLSSAITTTTAAAAVPIPSDTNTGNTPTVAGLAVKSSHKQSNRNHNTNPNPNPNPNLNPNPNPDPNPNRNICAGQQKPLYRYIRVGESSYRLLIHSDTCDDNNAATNINTNASASSKTNEEDGKEEDGKEEDGKEEDDKEEDDKEEDDKEEDGNEEDDKEEDDKEEDDKDEDNNESVKSVSLMSYFSSLEYLSIFNDEEEPTNLPSKKSIKIVEPSPRQSSYDEPKKSIKIVEPIPLYDEQLSSTKLIYNIKPIAQVQAQDLLSPAPKDLNIPVSPETPGTPTKKKVGLHDLFQKMKENLKESLARHVGEDDFVGVSEKGMNEGSSRYASQLESRRQIVNVIKIAIGEQRQELEKKLLQEEEDLLLPQDCDEKHMFEFVHAVTRGAFCEPCMVTRPVYFNDYMMNLDMIRTGKSMKVFARDLKLAGENNTGVKTICQIKNELVCLPRKFPIDDVPLTSLRVQWRLSHHGKSPSLQMAFILLNRYGSLLALVRVSANSACAVFESMPAAERVMEYLTPVDRPRLLIGAWWYKKCMSTHFRRTPIDKPAMEWLYVRFYGRGKQERSRKSDFDNVHPKLGPQTQLKEIDFETKNTRKNSLQTNKKDIVFAGTTSYIRSLQERSQRMYSKVTDPSLDDAKLAAPPMINIAQASDILDTEYSIYSI